MLTIEGVGGTGKAVINLLKFTQGVATRLSTRDTPDLSCVVIDQDSDGTWEGVPHITPFTNVGTFAPAYDIITPEQRAAALLFFTQDELDTDIQAGFHSQPKLAAALAAKFSSTLETGFVPSAPTHVLIYSDFGGTGAGLGPVRLRQLMDSPTTTKLIVIVFGKYLDAGTANSTGLEWLRECTGEFQAAGHAGRKFLAYYVNVPPAKITSGLIPPSGLNPTPALLLAANFVWSLAEHERQDKVSIFLGLANMQEASRLEIVRYDSRLFSLKGDAETLVIRLRTCATSGNLGPIIPPAEDNLGVAVAQFVGEWPDCWKVFRAPQPQGQLPDPEINWEAAFAETFSSIPDPKAAVTHFHRAIRDVRPSPTCDAAFRRLVGLYMQNKLHAFRAEWRQGEPAIYVLANTPLPTNGADHASFFRDHVVGAFSEEFPFWTTQTFLHKLNALPVDRPTAALQTVRVTLRQGGACARIYVRPTTVSAPNTNEVSVTLAVGDPPSLSWSWAIDLNSGVPAASNWDGLCRRATDIPLLNHHLDIRQGRTTFLGGHQYQIQIRGLAVGQEKLPDDGIFVGNQSGRRFYEVQVLRDAGQGPFRVAKLARDIYDQEPIDTGSRDATLVVGNAFVTWRILA